MVLPGAIGFAAGMSLISETMKKIMLVFGTRPEGIKMCPLVQAFRRLPGLFETFVCVTGQHREMLDQVLRIFEVSPDYDMDIMRAGQDLYDVTARVLVGMRDVLRRVQPDVVLVHGDTTSSTAAAMAAFYQQIPVGHVEAGLRTRHLYSPWPEEMNRQLTARLASFHFAPTELAAANLREEKVQGDVLVVGNTVIDALQSVCRRLSGDNALAAEQAELLRQAGYDMARLCGKRRMVLITGHRRENFGKGFLNIVTAIRDLGERYPEVDFVYPVHLNPRVREPIAAVFGGKRTPLGNVFLIDPLEYTSFVYLMKSAYLVLTDSGGIQEEAPGLGKPVLVMRDTTERPEALSSGTVRLVGADYERITQGVASLLDDAVAYEQMSRAVNPYGDGHACERIVNYFSD